MGSPSECAAATAAQETASELNRRCTRGVASDMAAGARKRGRTKPTDTQDLYNRHGPNKEKGLHPKNKMTDFLLILATGQDGERHRGSLPVVGPTH